jgi:hypothetical protein
MKLGSASTKIDIKSISSQTEAQIEAAKVKNQASSSFYKASTTQKPAAIKQLNQAQKTAGSRQLANFNQRLSEIRSTTAQLNEETKQSNLDANVLMAKVISPPGSKLQPQKLGQFIDKYA